MTHIYNRTKLEKSLGSILNLCLIAVIALLTSGTMNAQSLFFSEFIEGSGQNKAFEIYNPTDDAIDLGDYIVLGNYNGFPYNDTLRFESGTMLASKDVYVVAHEAADSAIVAVADSLIEDPFAAGTSFITVFNGDDARGLFKIEGTDTTLIDLFGTTEVDPGSGWDVAGVASATQDHTLLRKTTITEGNPDSVASFGTSAEDSEWIVLDKDDLSNIGLPTQEDVVEAVKVTFNVNTATMPDTLQPWHVLQIRGGVSGADVAGTGLGSQVTWDAASIVTNNVGGDYWSITFDMSPGDTLNYKFWAGIDVNTPLINGGEQGWESGDNNQFILSSEAVADTTVPMQWYESRQAPFTSEADSVTIYFRVNVGAQVQTDEFDPETYKVGVRGNGAFFANDWGTGNYLQAGAQQGNNYFYEGYVRAQKDSVAAIDGSINYKFVFEKPGGDVTWESTPDRPVTLPASDSTLHFVFFNDTPPTNAVILDTKLNFSVNVGILEGIGFFNSSIDTVNVTGTFNSWNNTANKLLFNNDSGNYDGLNIPFKASVGTRVQYKYYIKWDKTRDDTSSVNYLSGITHDGSGWEEPGVTGGGDRILDIIDAPDQPVQNQYYNGVEPKALMIPNNVEGGAITVTFSYDMNPAKDNLAQPFDPANDSVYLFVDTPFFALTNGITVPGDDGGNFLNTSAEEKERLRFTDDNDDGIYELDLELQLPTLNHIGFRIAYGEPTSADGSLFPNGSGFAAGRRHYQYVQPIVDSDLKVSWPSTMTLPTLTWKATDLDWETPPDYTKVTVANENGSDLAKTYRLEQNYPNPFNPTTNISFNLPNAANVNLTVYNLLGQKVATLINGKTMTSGSHAVSFDAKGLSSGVYIYRLEAGSFVSNKRMTLIK